MIKRRALRPATFPAPLQFNNNLLPASATTQINYGINLPATPSTPSYNSAIPNSDLLNPADFTSDPTVAGTGKVIGTDASTFVNESIDGGSATAYDAAGTPANLQLRWAKTSNSSNTWELFYQTDPNATGAATAWQNAGSVFTFNSAGQLTGGTGSIALTGVTVGSTNLGNLTLVTPTGNITQFASTSGQPTINQIQANGFPAGQLQSVSVGNNGLISGTFSNGKNVNLARNSTRAFQRRRPTSKSDRRRIPGDDKFWTSDRRCIGANRRTVARKLERGHCDRVHQVDRDPASLFGEYESDHHCQPNVARPVERHSIARNDDPF